MLSIMICALTAAIPPDTLIISPRPAGPVVRSTIAPVSFSLRVSDSAQGQRPRAFEYSKAYEIRLTIHHWASFATVPLFAAEYWLGQKLIGDTTRNAPSRGPHQAVALGIAGLFAVNTVTGGWNLWDARKDPNGRLRRYIHAALMIASDAGFVATGASAPGGHSRGQSNRLALERTHRGIAVASMSTALVSYAMMLVWK